jgi:hypothetical protein
MSTLPPVLILRTVRMPNREFVGQMAQKQRLASLRVPICASHKCLLRDLEYSKGFI